MGIDQLTCVQSCRQLSRWGILSLSMCIYATIEKMSEDLNAERHISTFKSNVVHTITNNELSRLTSLAGHWTGQ